MREKRNRPSRVKRFGRPAEVPAARFRTQTKVKTSRAVHDHFGKLVLAAQREAKASEMNAPTLPAFLPPRGRTARFGRQGRGRCDGEHLPRSPRRPKPSTNPAAAPRTLCGRRHWRSVCCRRAVGQLSGGSRWRPLSRPTGAAPPTRRDSDDVMRQCNGIAVDIESCDGHAVAYAGRAGSMVGGVGRRLPRSHAAVEEFESPAAWRSVLLIRATRSARPLARRRRAACSAHRGRAGDRRAQCCRCRNSAFFGDHSRAVRSFGNAVAARRSIPLDLAARRRTGLRAPARAF